MQTLKLFACMVALGGATASSTAWAHPKLETTVPAKSAVLTSSPAVITLHFNETVEPDFTTIKVIDANGKNVVTQKVALDNSDRKTVVVPLSTLRAGQYKVQWRTSGPDGHRQTGDYVFSVK